MARKVSSSRLNVLSAREVLTATKTLTDGGGLTLKVIGADASWVMRYTGPSGRRREMGLGVVLRGSIKQAGASLTAARDAAHEARELLRKGIDPLQERDDRREAAKAADEARKVERQREQWTLARAARDFHEREVESNVKLTARHKSQWLASLEHHVPPALWHLPVTEITPPMLLDGLKTAKPHERARRHGNLGETLRRVRQRLDMVFDDLVFFGRIPHNPAKVIGKKLTKARPVNADKHLTALDYRAVPELMAKVRAMPGTAARSLEFCVLTASRTTEVLLAQWGEVDLVRGVWVIPAHRMKAREEHTVPLSPRAVEILRGQIGQDERLVFPSTHPDRKGFAQSNMSMLAVLDRLNMRGATTVHGLRASFSTWGNETGAARPDVIEAALAHREADRVRAAYNRAQFEDERRALLEAWASYCSRPIALALAA
jgi:integrase